MFLLWINFSHSLSITGEKFILWNIITRRTRRKQKQIKPTFKKIMNEEKKQKCDEKTNKKLKEERIRGVH